MKTTFAILLAATVVLTGPAAAQDRPAPPTGTAKPEPKPPGKFGPMKGGEQGLGKAVTGIAIMRLRQTQTFGKTEIAELDIRIEQEGGFDHRRRLMRYVKRDAASLERSLLRFIDPPGFRWLAALTIEVKDGDDDQWLYLPDIRKVKRVPRAQSTENFAGTGFAIEDLRAEALDAHRYKTLKKLELQGRPAYEIEATPIKGHVRALVGYAKRHIFVDAERWVELRIDYYDLKGQYLKTQENSDWQPVGDIFRPYRVVMREPARKRTTWIKFRSWEANVPLDDDLFTTRELMREDH